MEYEKRARLNGFSLVELLVVIAIVAVLMSFLLPSLAKARDAAIVTQCLSNQHQQGTALNAYASSWKGSLPPNCSEKTGNDPTLGVYQKMGTSSFLYGANVSNLNRARVDDSNTGQMAWVNGLGLVFAGEFIPYTLGGARILWCPGDRRDNFNGANQATGMLGGPGQYWSTGSVSTSLKDKPYNAIGGTGGGAWTMNFAYGYRSLGGITGYSKGKWNIELMAKYVATVDVVQNIYGNTAAFSNTQPNFSHSQSNNTYVGFNRLWYDGHARWYQERGQSWELLCGPYGSLVHDTGFGNTYSESMWRLYDAE